MTPQETSDRLDTLLNKSTGGIVLDEYVKSLYLTQAQNLFIESVLTSYEYGDRMRHLIGPLLMQDSPTISPVTGVQYQVPLKEDIKQIVYEVTDGSKTTVPMDWNDIHYTLQSPFRKPDEKIAYRVTFNRIAYLYTKPAPISYKYIYCKIPSPIVLQNLPDNLEIQGVTIETASELSDDSMLNIIDATVNLIVKNKSMFAKPQSKQPDKQKI